jgi:hypothetical protein
MISPAGSSRVQRAMASMIAPWTIRMIVTIAANPLSSIAAPENSAKRTSIPSEAMNR